MIQELKQQAEKAIDLRLMLQAAALLLSVFGGLWWLSGEMSRLSSDIENLGLRLGHHGELVAKEIAILKEANERQDVQRAAIANELKAKVADRYTRRDQWEWCVTAQKTNAGFDCPDPYELPGYKEPRTIR